LHRIKQVKILHSTLLTRIPEYLKLFQTHRSWIVQYEDGAVRNIISFKK